MCDYSIEMVNSKDYLRGKCPIYRSLYDIAGKPKCVDINTHLRMMYGHVCWDDLIIKLTPDNIQLLEKHSKNIQNEDLLDTIKPGEYIAVLHSETMGPLTYNDMINGDVPIELYNTDMAIERAAYWFVDDILDSISSMGLFTKYFTLAFRLALMQGDMPDEERFSKQRLNKVWGETKASVMFSVGQLLQKQSIESMKSGRWMNFDLTEEDVHEYLSCFKK